MTSALQGQRLRRRGVEAPDGAPVLYGGQAVIEGVMMRGADAWAVAVRRPDEHIHVERHALGDLAQRHPIVKRPVLRGIWALVDSLAVGMQALQISAAHAMVEDDEGETGLPEVAMGAAMVVALVAFVSIFIVLPSTAVTLVDRWLLDGALGGGAAFHAVESVVRIAVFLAYLTAISLLGDIKRVFQYHGAEHQTISAWEHGHDLSPDDVGRHSTIHVRCGTNFLILVMLVAMLVYTLVGVIVAAPAGGFVLAVGYHVGLRVLLLPLVAGLAYEFLRLGADAEGQGVLGLLMRPGLLLQRITTRRPDDGQREVAIRAFAAVANQDELAGRLREDTLPSVVVGLTTTGEAG